jgi:ribonucleotide reductase beta subunit family protein with ferritin-like domain
VPEMVEKQIYRFIIATVINAARKESVFEQEVEREENLKFADEEK